MTFDFPGYELKFIQKDRSRDGSDHLSTHVFKFYSPITQFHYIVRADHHLGDVFAIKFYCKKDRRSAFKYTKIINRKDVGNIIMTCAKSIPFLLQAYPSASFAIAASSSVDILTKTIEQAKRTQRYNLYCYMIRLKFGTETFEHIAYDQVSSYLLLNKHSETTRAEVEAMFRRTYPVLSEMPL